MTDSGVIAKRVDAQGLICPEPVQMLHAAIRQVAVGECVQLVATDPSTQRDVANFCRFLGHDLTCSEQENKVYRYIIRKQS